MRNPSIRGEQPGSAAQSGPSSLDEGLRFLGVGASSAPELGAAAAVLERKGAATLLIDCGPGVPQRFEARYGALPRALFITHVHLDHVAGLEALQTRLALARERVSTRLYVPTAIIRDLHARLATLPFPQAEGSGNFWDVFQLIPVTDGFWHDGEWFDVFPVRHHAPGFAWGLRLPGRFVFTGDTRPIPEELRFQGRAGERLFHDCAWDGNPSHTGWDDVLREYDEVIRRRLVVYHYESEAAGDRLDGAGARVARVGELVGFTGERCGQRGPRPRQKSGEHPDAPSRGPDWRIAS